MPLCGEEIGRAVRAVEDADLPGDRRIVGGGDPEVARGRPLRPAPRADIAGARGRARRGRRSAEDEGARAAEIVGHVEAAARWRGRRARRRPRAARDLERRAGLHGDGLPAGSERHRAAPKSAPVRAMTASASEAQRGAGDGDFERRRASGLPTRRLAMRKESASMGPEGGTPTCQ